MKYMQPFHGFSSIVLWLTLSMITSVFGTSLSMVGSPVKMSSGGGSYGRITRLSTGQLLGIYTTSSGSVYSLTVCQSNDNAASWTDIGTVTTGNADIGNGFLLELPNTTGAANPRILAAFRNHSWISGPSNITYFRMTVCYSDDLGKTWKFLSQPEGKNPPNGLWEPFMRIAHDGSIQLYYSRENSQTDQDIVQHISRDNGETWGPMVTIAGATTQGRDGMPGITEFDTGSGKRLLCIFETTQDGPFHVKSVTSDDDGITWGNRSVVYVPTGTNNNAGSPQVATLGGNVLVAIFMTDEDLSPHKWITGAGVKSLVSTDGVNWSNKLSVSPPQSNWPGIFPLNDNEFITTFDHAGGVQSQAIKLS
ncbi:hypothetical protein INT44_000918 [Umbelopsis vinacea]|uniref:Glycoside hydrolase family 93 protein n=1 Tax=Umbelopsis vinacea TaxID=44442 RepID=A0A8H7UNF4_9FUNG|nr:hypothetical protein INT44_000918 [Umbelopsis vinacea]